MRTYKSLERKTRIMGTPVIDMLLLLVLGVFLLLFGSLVGTFVSVPKWYYISIIGIDFAAYIFLKKIDKKQHPSYLLSYLSFHVLQPKKIQVDSQSLKINRNLYVTALNGKNDQAIRLSK